MVRPRGQLLARSRRCCGPLPWARGTAARDACLCGLGRHERFVSLMMVARREPPARAAPRRPARRCAQTSACPPPPNTQPRRRLQSGAAYDARAGRDASLLHCSTVSPTHSAAWGYRGCVGPETAEAREDPCFVAVPPIGRLLQGRARCANPRHPPRWRSLFSAGLLLSKMAAIARRYAAPAAPRTLTVKTYDMPCRSCRKGGDMWRERRMPPLFGRQQGARPGCLVLLLCAALVDFPAVIAAECDSSIGGKRLKRE